MKTSFPLEAIFVISSVMQLFTQTVQGDSTSLQNEPFGHPYVHQRGHHPVNSEKPASTIHQHGHHPANHPGAIGSSLPNGHQRHSKRGSKRGSKRSAKRHHPKGEYQFDGKHSKRHGRDRNFQHHHDQGMEHKHHDYGKSPSDGQVVSDGSNTAPIVHGNPSRPSSSMSSMSSLSSSLSKSSSSTTTQKSKTVGTTALSNTKDGSLESFEIDILNIQKSEPLETRIELETKHENPRGSIETNVIEVHSQNSPY